MTLSYHCSRCGKLTERSVLTEKKVSFLETGLSGRTLRSRVIEYLCAVCLISDEHWNKPPVKKPFTGISVPVENSKDADRGR